MPVLVNPKTCLDRERCFAAGACPYGAFYHNSLKRTWEVDATICGDCPGPCLNFCDQDALHWGDDLIDLKLVKAELEGTMTREQVAEARIERKKEVAAAAKEEKEQKEAKAGGIIHLTAANFEQEVLRSDLPVVVDCWAAWCGPCKQFAPIFEETSRQYAKSVKFAKLDTDAQPALAAGLGVQALPTIMMFYRGQIANVVEGALPAQHFQTWIYQTLAAIRQYQAEFESQAEEAITAAAQKIATINGNAPEGLEGEPQPHQGPAGEHKEHVPSTGVILDAEAGEPQPGTRNGAASEENTRGKRSSSGLYFP
jgi:thioredoxin 2